MSNKDYLVKISEKIHKKMTERAKAVADQLKPVIQAGDAENVPKEVWMEMIRRNWHDPAWRAKQSDRVGSIKFVQDALEAHGLNPSLLHQNADVIRLGLSDWAVDASPDYARFMAEYAMKHNAVPIPESPPTG